MSREEIQKTYKIFIGGQFPRTESGRYYPLYDKKKALIANVCLASRKDFRNAVVAARGAFGGWSGRSAFNRSQVLYRIAEMMEGRKEQFMNEMLLQGASKKEATDEICQSIDRMVYYAGWCDKYQAVFSSVNPVASSHFNFSVPEPMGVVAIAAPESSSLLGLVSVIVPAILSGNTCVALASYTRPLCAITLAEALQTGDLPAGVVNILTGTDVELLEHFASHMDVNALVYCGDAPARVKMAAEKCSLNVKRFIHNTGIKWADANAQSPSFIMNTTEIKTTWHPVENIGSVKAGY